MLLCLGGTANFEELSGCAVRGTPQTADGPQLGRVDNKLACAKPHACRRIVRDRKDSCMRQQ